MRHWQSNELEVSRTNPLGRETDFPERYSPSVLHPMSRADLRERLGIRSTLPFSGEDLGRLVCLVSEGALSRRAAKDVLLRMAETGGDPKSLVEEMGLASVSDADQLGAVIDEVLSKMPEQVEAYRGGKRNLLGLFIGEVMKATKGAADPQAARGLLIERLGA